MQSINLAKTVSLLSRLRFTSKPWSRLCINNLATANKPKLRLVSTSSGDQTVAATKTDINDYSVRYRKGDELFGFRVEEITDVPELHLTALRLQHSRTGADYIHIARNDTNNVFSVAFRTPPTNSSGVCHILEHLALCGSNQYPCRDPFFKMLSRSLSTFMNAWTGSDWTMYPFSTQNFHDYNNLMHVYLDAAFFPNLRKLDFHQEGWRLEHETCEDQKSPIIFKGVVFNEMKGVFSSSANHFMQNLQNKIFPSNTYSHISGGDPLEIPNLTWESLRKFHERCYHPSNARFFSYGTFPLESHLSNVDNWVLSKFDRLTVNTTVPDQELWKSPKEEEITCTPDPMIPDVEKQTTVSVAFLLDNITNSYEYFTLAVLSNLLMDGANSPFYQSLITPEIGSDFAPGSGFDGNIKQSMFAIGLCGIPEADVEKVKQIIEKTLDDVIKYGFPKERIESVLHSIELSNKHQTTNFGLMLNMALNPVWNHGGNPVAAIQINDHMIWFKNQLAQNPHFLQNKVKQYFKDNMHKLTLVMKPNEKFSSDLAQKEALLLKEKISMLSEKDREMVYAEGIALSKLQKEQEDISCLPTLMIAEVEPLIERTPVIETKVDDVPVFTVKEATNGIVYFRAISSISELPQDLVPLLPLFCSVVTRMGAGKLDYLQQDQEVSLCTGGLSAQIHLSEDPSYNNKLEQGIILYSHCLERNIIRMLDLWKNIFHEVHFGDADRLRQLIRMDASELVQGIADHGHSYAMKQANSGLSAASALMEVFGGVSQVSKYQELAAMDSVEEVITKLKRIADILLSKNRLRCSLHTTPQFQEEGVSQLSHLISSMPIKELVIPSGYKQLDFKPVTSKTHLVMPFPVNYIAKGNRAASYGHPDFAKLKVLSKLLSRKYLHREIREQGGAYGSGAAINTGGIWSFFSFRDPNTTRTLEAFDRSIEWALKGSFTLQDLDEAKLGTFSDLDQPVAPGNKGLSWFTSCISDNMRQEYKDRIFKAQKEDLIEVAEKYLSNASVEGYALMGPESELSKKDNWKVLNLE